MDHPSGDNRTAFRSPAIRKLPGKWAHGKEFWINDGKLAYERSGESALWYLFAGLVWHHGFRVQTTQGAIPVFIVPVPGLSHRKVNRKSAECPEREARLSRRQGTAG